MKTLTLGPPPHQYRMIDLGDDGKLVKAWRAGVPYESDVVKDMAEEVGRIPEFSLGVAVDVGANVGNHSMWLAAVCQMHVFAFEPIRYDALEANVALNNFQRKITVNRTALGAKPSRVRLVGKGRFEESETGGFIVRTLDSYLIPNVSILKVDVEGMDADVIRGGLATINRSRPVIYAEAWDDESRNEIDLLLKPFGYTYAKKFRWHQNKWTYK